MDRGRFFALPTDEIAELVRQIGRPKVGVYIPDGNRRLVLASTDLREETVEFLNQLALTQTSGFLDNLKTLFSHGLYTLFVPLFSRSVLMRGTNYRQITVLKTLGILFKDQLWLDFYRESDVRIKIYGDLSALRQTELEKALEWMDTAETLTSTNKKHLLYLGIGGEPVVGYDVLNATRAFHEEFHSEPTSNEIISYLYGSEISSVDFVIMSSKFGGVGALPSLICAGNTRVYYLPVPGILGLNERTYRAILFDLLFVSEEEIGEFSREIDRDDRQRIYSWYADHADMVIGLGQKIGPVWAPDLSAVDGL